MSLHLSEKRQVRTIRTIIAGLAGGAATNLAMLLTFRAIGFGWDGGGVLISSPMQSRKLIAVWTQMEPLPLIVTDPWPIVSGLLALGVAHAFVYGWLSRAWPPGVLPRALRLAGLLYLFSYVFWEFFTPFNQFGEPLPLIALELCFWAVVALAEGFAIALVMERGK